MRKLSDYGPSLIVLATAMLVLFAGPSAVQRLTYEQTRTEITQARLGLDQNNILAELNQAYQDIATVVEPSVVHISAQSEVRDVWGRRSIAVSSGSGWIYDDQGHIVTNHHVIEDADRIEVQLHSGELRQAKIIGSDQFTDIAVLKIPAGRLHPSRRSTADQPVRQGDLVFAFGSPFDFRFSMSSGVVSGQGRSVGVIRDQFGRRVGYENFIQVDAAINPGNSGGPLTDYRGQVIGMNTAIATQRQGSFDEGQFAGIGLAIPLQMIDPVVSQLIETGVVTKGYLGIEARDVTPQIAARLSEQGFIGTGVFVMSVQEDGPALDAGVLVDDVITHVNAQRVASMDQLRSVVSSILPGEEAVLTLWRFDAERDLGEVQDVAVTLGRLDTLRTAGFLPPDHDRSSIVDLGIGRMATSTPVLAGEMGVEHHAGVLLQEILPESALDLEGIRPGATIVAVMDRPIAGVEEFIAMLGEFDLRRGVRVTIMTHDNVQVDPILRISPR